MTGFSMLLTSGVCLGLSDFAFVEGLSYFVGSFLVETSRDQTGGALCSATVPRPSGSSLMSLRRARHRPDPTSTIRHSREGGNPVLPRTHHARCLGAWGEWRSGIKEEAEGRGTAAKLLTPSAEAYKTPSVGGCTNAKQYKLKAYKTKSYV
jgi:hypothetical protein